MVLLVLDWGFGRRSVWLALLIMLRLGESLPCVLSFLESVLMPITHIGSRTRRRNKDTLDRENEFEIFRFSFLPFASSCTVYYIHLLAHLLIKAGYSLVIA